jgi:hypothetical protein
MLIPRNYFWDLELITSDEAIKTKPKTEGTGYNYYNVKTGRLYLQSFKTSRKYNPININLSNYTQKVILKSYNDIPRKWLFTTNNGKYASNTSFNTQIGESIGITVNQFRRAFINYHLHVEGMSRDKIARVSGHSVDVNELIYSTIDSNEAIQNTIYDKNVNVEIKEGRKRGETFVGVGTHSLKPNRDKFPYSIVFDAKDNLKDEQANKIPDASDGITMYVEPVPEQGTHNSHRNRNNRR